MKALAVAFIMMIALAPAFLAHGQSEFILGAEWVNNPNKLCQYPPDISQIPSAQDWTNMKDLGLTWGVVSLCRNNEPDSYALSALNSAAQNGMKLMLNRYNMHDPTLGQRWLYHPECQSQFPSTGRIGSPTADNGATLFPDDRLNSANSWQAIVGINSPGYMVQGLLSPFCFDQPDGMTYYVKLHLRLDPGTPLTHNAVVTVSVVRGDGTQVSSTIYADQFGAGYNFTYTDVLALSFTKTQTGPLSAANPQAYQQSLHSVPDPIEVQMWGATHHASQQSSVSLDYRVYWLGNVNCHLDYVCVDDNTANDVFAGVYDISIDNEVNLFMSQPGLGMFKVRDEVSPDNYGQYLCVGRVEQRIRQNVIPAGYPKKTGMHYNVGYWDGPQYTGRDVAWSQNAQLTSDIYPITAGTPLPDNPSSYTTNFQNQIQNALIPNLLTDITYANAYSVPFWFTPQVDSWVGQLREPTVLELTQMVNLGLAYGAKGIQYFLYISVASGGTVTAEGLAESDGTPRRMIYGGTSYSGDKWATVKSINQGLSVLGSTLVNLTWQNAFSIHTLNGASTGTYVPYVTTDVDAANQTYVELALFTDVSSNRYIMLINRRTVNTENRNITATFSLPSGTWEISDVASGNLWIVPNNGSFTDNINPGSAKLYKVSPSTATWSGTKSLANNVTVGIGATLTVSPGATITFPVGTGGGYGAALNVYGHDLPPVVVPMSELDLSLQALAG